MIVTRLWLWALSVAGAAALFTATASSVLRVLPLPHGGWDYGIAGALAYLACILVLCVVSLTFFAYRWAHPAGGESDSPLLGSSRSLHGFDAPQPIRQQRIPTLYGAAIRNLETGNNYPAAMKSPARGIIRLRPVSTEGAAATGRSLLSARMAPIPGRTPSPVRVFPVVKKTAAAASRIRKSPATPTPRSRRAASSSGGIAGEVEAPNPGRVGGTRRGTAQEVGTS